MSKIGSRKIIIPEGVQVTLRDNKVSVAGPKGELSLALLRNIKLVKNENQISVERLGNNKESKSFHGLYQRLITNMIEGVCQGFEKKLDFKGVGFRVEVQGNKIILNVGFFHPKELLAPEGIEVKVEKNIITVSGIDKQKVGQFAAQIRAVKPVEPYKGKGIKYFDEIPRRKPGKAAKAITGPSA